MKEREGFLARRLKFASELLYAVYSAADEEDTLRRPAAADTLFRGEIE